MIDQLLNDYMYASKHLVDFDPLMLAYRSQRGMCIAGVMKTLHMPSMAQFHWYGNMLATDQLLTPTNPRAWKHPGIHKLFIARQRHEHSDDFLKDRYHAFIRVYIL
jgi:hypothetical protein